MSYFLDWVIFPTIITNFCKWVRESHPEPMSILLPKGLKIPHTLLLPSDPWE